MGTDQRNTRQGAGGGQRRPENRQKWLARMVQRETRKITDRPERGNTEAKLGCTDARERPDK